MTRAEYLFVIVWIINFIISVLYYLWGALFYVPARERQDKNEEEYLHDNRRTYCYGIMSDCRSTFLFSESFDLYDNI